MKIVLFTNQSKDPTLSVSAAAAAVLLDAGMDCVRYDGCDDVFEGAYAALSLGGDGTFLRCAQIAAPRGVAVLGIHLGHTGYLSRIYPEKLEKLKELASFSVKERDILKANLIGDGVRRGALLAVNDFVFSRGTAVQTVSLEISVDGHPIGSFMGDGAIVSTATGSTGYNLSAGGPVADPELNALLVTPICAHTSRSHAFILSPERMISIEPSHMERREIFLSADGGEPRRLIPGERVEIQVSETPLLCLEPTGSDFFENVRIHRL